jgi:hypothetical protein
MTASLAERARALFPPSLSPRGGMPRARRTHLLVMGGIALGAATIGVMILPGESERIAALERDGQIQRALGMLEARYARGDHSARTLAELQRFYERSGETGKSRLVLEQLAAQRPRDAVVQRQLAALYKSTQDETAYIKALQSQLALRYSQPACKELIGLHRRNSDFAAEQATIADCASRGYRVADDLIRLAFLESADNNLARSAQILRAVDDRRWLRDARDRFLLFESLVETRQPQEAVRRAARWLRGQPNEDMAIDLVYKLVEFGNNEMALQMARDIGQPGDGVSLAVGEIMVDQVQYAAARAYLAGWIEQAKSMSLESATRFVTAALDAEDPLLALRGGERFGLAKLAQGDLVRLAEVLAASARWAEIDRVRGAIEASEVAANPMLAAAFELRDGRAGMARAYLARVRIEQLDERRIGFFARLNEQAGRNPAAQLRLREPAREAALQPAQPFGALPAGVGPKETLERQRIQKRAEARRKLRERPKTAEKKAPAPAPAPAQAAEGGGGLFKFLFPKASGN